MEPGAFITAHWIVFDPLAHFSVDNFAVPTGLPGYVADIELCAYLFGDRDGGVGAGVGVAVWMGREVLVQGSE